MGAEKEFGFKVLSDPDEWDRLLLRSESALPFITSTWIGAISELFGYKFELVSVSDEEGIVCVFCVYYKARHGKLFSLHPSLTPYNAPAFIRSLKISDVRWAKDKFSILTAVQSYIKKKFIYPYLFLDTDCYDLRPFTWNHWNVRPAYTFLVDPIATKLDSDIVRRAKNCLAEGYRVSFDWIPDVFVQLFRKTMERQGFVLHYTDEQFIQFLNKLKTAGLVWMATSFDLENRPHASWVQLHLNHVRLFNWNSATNLEFSNSGGTSLLVSEMLNHIRQMGFTEWDLCGADNKSVSGFKSKLGGKLQLYFKADYSLYSKISKAYFRLINR